jgi:hypothetical protein
MPAHLRALDASVLEQAGRNTPSLIDQGMALVRDKNLGAAQLLWQAAQLEALPDREQFGEALNDLVRENPGLPVPAVGESRPRDWEGTQWGFPGPIPFADLMLQENNRRKALELLGNSSQPAVQQLLGFRSVTHTTLFPASQSASGQALDAAIAISGLLLEQGNLTAPLSHAMISLAQQANAGADSQPLEELLMEMMSLGQRFDWSQLSAFVRGVPDAETLRILANLVRKADTPLPVIFSAVNLSGHPAGVAQYLSQFGQTGAKDLGLSLRFGTGAVNELLRRRERVYDSGTGGHIAVSLCARSPRLGLALKWSSYLLSGILFGAALRFARPPVSDLEQPLQVPGFRTIRQILFALGFLLIVVLLSEPFLAQESQKVEFPFRLRLPTVGSAIAAGTASARATLMNPPSLLTLLLFFVLQGLLYVACLFKLAEIRRQRVAARMKLRLLENEDHLFDAGLYLGFVGTIISLILVSLGLTKFSLMAAYSSTSFGIIFVSIFKIFHLRPARRRLLLESEGEQTEPSLPPGGSAVAVRL